MLSNARPRPRRVRHQSLRQEYEEFLLQRIEEYKDQLSRQHLLAIADEAVRELEVGPEEQLVLTEVLVLEHVDRLIMRRLNLPTFRKWRDRHLKLRQAQTDPLYWGLDPETPLTDMALRLEDSDIALLVGGGAAASGYFLAAHGWPTVLVDQNLTRIEAAEARAAAEGLAARFQALVVALGSWFPDMHPTLAIMDPETLTALEPSTRDRVISMFKDLTTPGGVHLVIPMDVEMGVLSFDGEALVRHYRDWGMRKPASNSPAEGFIATKP